MNENNFSSMQLYIHTRVCILYTMRYRIQIYIGTALTKRETRATYVKCFQILIRIFIILQFNSMKSLKVFFTLARLPKSK